MSLHPLFLRQFQQLLSPNFELEARHLDPHQHLELQAPAVPPADVYVMDASPLRHHTDAMVSSILEHHPNAQLLVLAEGFGETDAFSLLRLGAKGLLTYSEAPEQLSRSVKEVARGGFWVPRSLLSKFVDSILRDKGQRRIAKGMAELSRREAEVIDCLLQNLSNKEIASKLNIAERTAKFHVSNLLAKYGVQRRADLILLCYQSHSVSSQLASGVPANRHLT